MDTTLDRRCNRMDLDSQKYSATAFANTLKVENP
jgi:hypothetical protein